MKILKWIGIILIVLFAAFLIFTGTQPSILEVEKSATIKASPEKIFNVISDYRTWSEWSAWHKMDTTMEMKYEGEMGKLGAKYSWSSQNPMVGSGNQQIIELEESNFVKSEMVLNGEGGNFAWFNLKENEDNSTTVTWNMKGAETSFMMNWQNTVFKPMIEQSYDQSLADLKKLIESMPEEEIPNPFNLEVTEVAPQSIISIKDSCNPAEISSKLGELYGELSVFMAMNDGITEAGMPLALYHFYSGEKVVLEAALPVNGTVEPQGRINMTATPGGKVLKGIHLGSYESSESMHMGIEEYMKASNLEYAGPCWEVYANDPTTVEESAIETHIFYPIK